MKIIFWLIIFVIVFLAGVRYIERHSIFFPMKEMGVSPTDISLAYENVYFTTKDGNKLNGWFIPSEGSRRTVIFCHGNAGNISHRLEKIAILHDLGLNMFIFDYRGYGKSKGTPTEQGLYNDAQAAYEYVRQNRGIPDNDIIVYGESIGGAVAIDLAKDVDFRALITEDAFTSIKDMAKIAYPFLPHFIFSSRFDSLQKIKDIKTQKLIIHSIDDEIVPYRLGEKLFEQAAPPKKMLKLRGGHNTAFLDSKTKYIEGLREFVSELDKE